MDKLLKSVGFALLLISLTTLGYAQVYEFDNCGAEGRYGPNPGDCDYENFSVDIIGEGIQEWTVPESGEYRITAYGAQGGNLDDGEESTNAGEGAIIKSKISFEGNESLRIAVGQSPNGINFRGGEPNLGGWRWLFYFSNRFIW